MRAFLPSVSFITTLLMIEFLDELIFGAREAAWPLIRSDLNLTYVQVGLLLSAPNFVSNLIEPVIGVLGDVWNRRNLILGGGTVFVISLLLVALSRSFLPLLISFILFYPASGAFVSLSQAALMDTEPERHEQNMARWTLSGSLGIVVGPLIVGLTTSLEWSWQIMFLGFTGFAVLLCVLAWQFPYLNPSKTDIGGDRKFQKVKLWDGFLGALNALRRKEVLRWLTLLEFADLMMDVLHGFLALYFVDVIGLKPVHAGLAVAVWTGAGLLGDFLLIPLLEKVSGVRYLRVSALIVLFLYPIFLVSDGEISSLVLIGVLGLLNAGWYAIPKGQLYSSMPDQSGAVMTVGNIFGLVGGLIPLGIGLVAQRFGLGFAMWFIILGPLILVLGLPLTRSKIMHKEN